MTQPEGWSVVHRDYVARRITQLATERDEALNMLDHARNQVTDRAAKVLQLDNQLIDARERIETLEEQLAEARAELDTWVPAEVREAFNRKPTG